jgi:hypothetical protein
LKQCDEKRRKISRRVGNEEMIVTCRARDSVPFSDISLPPKQQRHPQPQHHQSYAINRNGRAPLAPSERYVNDIDGGSDKKDKPADAESI